MKPEQVCSVWGCGSVPEILTDTELQTALFKHRRAIEADRVRLLACEAAAKGLRLWGFKHVTGKHSDYSALILPAELTAPMLMLLPPICEAVRRLERQHYQLFIDGEAPGLPVERLACTWHRTRVTPLAAATVQGEPPCFR